MIARSLFLEDKKLRVADFDDVIVKTTSFIYVTHGKGLTSKLTPGQYATYKPKPGDTFDYRDFQQVTNPVVIKAYAEILRRMAAKGGDRGVFILTARSAAKPVEDFLRDIGIRNVTVIALGDSDPEKKADWIENQVKTNGYDDVFFMDDSAANVDAVRRRLQRYNIKKQIKLIKG